MIEAIIMAACLVCLWTGYWLGKCGGKPVDAGTSLMADVISAAKKCKLHGKFHGGKTAITLQTMSIQIAGDEYVLGVAPRQERWGMTMEYKGVSND